MSQVPVSDAMAAAKPVAPFPAQESPSSAGALNIAAAVGVAAVLSACGGGSDVPAALLNPVDARSQPDFLAHSGSRVVVVRRAVVSPTPTALFDWAERQFPALFNAHPSDQSAQGLVYRFYPNTGNYLGVLDGRVLVLGPDTGGQVVDVGSLQSFADAVMAGSGSQPQSDTDAARFLLHAQFSASEREIADVRARGYSAWLDAQFAMPLGQSGWDWMVAKGYSAIDTNEYFFANGVFRYMVWYHLTQSPDTVRKRWALALSEVFVVSWRGIKDVMNWDAFGMAAYWDLLCQHAFGNYRDLLEALTLNPAMGAFLSTRGNAREDPATGRLPDENYAREVMQLFSVGLHHLNMDGTPRLDARGQPIETYSADDVSNLARVFTGYNHDYSHGWFNSPKPPHLRVVNLPAARGRMVFDPNQHSALEKRFLGVVIPAGTSGPESLRIALDTLANHANVAPFLSRQLIQRMVTSNPSPAYVQRVAQVFNNNGSGVRGDLKAVLRAILLDDEARGAASLESTSFGKLREPMLRVAQWARTFKMRSLRGTWKMVLDGWSSSNDINQYPLDPPSVFSYYRPGYVPPGTALAMVGATAPEFQIVNESTVAAWANLVQGFAMNGFWVNAPDQAGNPGGPSPTDGFDLVPDYSAEKALVGDTVALVNRLNLLLCAGQLSAATVQIIVNGLRADNIRADAPDPFKQTHVARAVLFVMCAAEYLVQR